MFVKINVWTATLFFNLIDLCYIFIKKGNINNIVGDKKTNKIHFIQNRGLTLTIKTITKKLLLSI